MYSHGSKRSGKSKHAISEESDRRLDLIEEKIAGLEAKLAMAEEDSKCASKKDLLVGEALGGELELRLMGEEKMLASGLNAAASGDSRRQLKVCLLTQSGAICEWANMDIVVQTAESVADADVSAPVLIDGPVSLVKGQALFCVEMDTDAGATKTYAGGDSVDVTVKVASDDKLLGHTVAAVTHTLDVE